MKTMKIVLMALLAAYMLPDQSAQAADKACVYLVPGAGYVAKARVKTEHVTGEWSSHFVIGQTSCVSLDGLPANTTYMVEVHAIAGNTVMCSPFLRTDESKPFERGSITFFSSGTTLHHGCWMPE